MSIDHYRDTTRAIAWAIALVLVVIFAWGLYACGSTIGPDSQSNAAGQAAYSLERTADGTCRVRITSGREVTHASLHVGKDCTLNASAESLDGRESLDLLRDALSKVPGL